MNWRTMKLLMVLALLLPALSAAAIRVIEVNGENRTERVVSGLVIRGDGVFITSDRIFSDGF